MGNGEVTNSKELSTREVKEESFPEKKRIKVHFRGNSLKEAPESPHVCSNEHRLCELEIWLILPELMR